VKISAYDMMRLYMQKTTRVARDVVMTVRRGVQVVGSVDGGRLSYPLNMTKHLGTRLDSDEGRNDIKLTVLLKMMTWMN